MTVDHEQRAYLVFREALDRAPPERSAYLDSACAGDAALREEVAHLVDAHGRMGGFLDRPVADDLVRPAGERIPEIGPGAAIGAYRIVRRLSGGASGTVYEAMQARPQRRVALKVLRAGFASAAAKHRFLEEAEVLARLDHPGIARIVEAGVHVAEGAEVPFFALEYVEDARPITDHVRDAGLDVRQRVALVAGVCDAVHHGHQKAILHRDLKPANLLVARDGRAKVIDFGIARDVGAGAERAAFAGTVGYVSPEQADPAGGDLDVRSDVYSLGVVLFELLTGRLPHDVAGLPLAEALRRVRTEPPAPPPKGLPRDLAAILGKALAPQRTERYSSAAALADDLRRHLAHRPVEAVHGGALYQGAKFARRQPLAFTALAAVVAVSVAAGVVGTRLAWEKEEERRATEFHAYVANVAAASAALQLDNVAGARLHLSRAAPHLRNWEWHHLAGSLDTSERTLRWEDRTIRSGAIDPLGQRIAAGGIRTGGPPGDPAEIRAWDAASGRVLWTEATDGRRADALAFSPDASLLAAGYANGSLELRDAATGALVATLAGHGQKKPAKPLHDRFVNAAAFDRDGGRLVTGSGDGTVRVWEVPSGRLLNTFGAADGSPGPRVICLALVRGGERLAAGLIDGSVVVWDGATGSVERRIRAHEKSVDGVAVSPDGTRLVTASRDSTVGLWDLATGARLASIAVHRDNVRDAAFSPSGDVFATASWDRTVGLYRAQDGAQVSRLRGHTNSVERVSFAPGGDEVVSFCRDGAIKTWRTAAEHQEPVLKAHTDSVAALAADPAGRWLVSASGGAENRTRVWDLRARRDVAGIDRSASSASALAVWPDGSRFVSASSRSVGVFGLPDARRLAGPAEALAPFALRRDGGVLFALAGNGKEIAWWRTDTWERIGAWDAGGTVIEMALSPDARFVATSDDDGTLSIWDAATRTRLARRRAGDSPARQLVFSPSGDRLAVCARGSADVQILGVPGLAPAGSLEGHASTVGGAAYSPDGSRIATASIDGTVRIWDAATLEPVAVLDARPDPVYCVTFTDGGRTLLGGGGDATGPIRVWTAPGLLVSPR